MNQAYILSGLPGSGKSTFSQKLAKKSNIVILNADSVGEMLKGDYKIYGSEKNFRKIRNIAGIMINQMIAICVEERLDFIVDETTLKSLHRERLIITIFRLKSTFSINLIDFCSVPFKTCLERRLKQTRGMTKKKWIEILDKMNSIYEPITPNEIEYYSKQYNDFHYFKVEDFKFPTK